MTKLDRKSEKGEKKIAKKLNEKSGEKMKKKSREKSWITNRQQSRHTHTPIFLAELDHYKKTLYDGPQTPTQWKSESVTNQPTDQLTD